MKTASARKSTALPRLSQSENAGLCSFFAAAPAAQAMAEKTTKVARMKVRPYTTI